MKIPRCAATVKVAFTGGPKPEYQILRAGVKMNSLETGFAPTISLPENTQVDLNAWLDRLRKYGEEAKDYVLNDITHTFAEFACKELLVEFNPYVQEGAEIFVKKKGRKERAIDMILDGANTPWLKLQAYEGLVPLFEKMAETTKASFGLIFSPPGKEKGFGDYAYAYIYSIPEFVKGQTRTITALALRINNYNAKDAFHCLRFLSGLGPIEKKKDNIDKTLLTKSAVFPVGQRIPLPPDEKGKFLTYPVETLAGLLFIIGQHLPEKFGKDQLRKALTGKALEKVYEKFKPTIHGIYHKFWSAAQGYDFELNPWAKKEILETFTEHMDLSAGSCPSAGSDPLEAIKSKEKKESNDGKEDELVLCPQCGLFAHRPICEYCGCAI